MSEINQHIINFGKQIKNEHQSIYILSLICKFILSDNHIDTLNDKIFQKMTICDEELELQLKHLRLKLQKIDDFDNTYDKIRNINKLLDDTKSIIKNINKNIKTFENYIYIFEQKLNDFKINDVNYLKLMNIIHNLKFQNEVILESRNEVEKIKYILSFKKQKIIERISSIGLGDEYLFEY